MKVVIGKYTTWVGPYQIAEALCFWAKPVEDKYGISSKPRWVHEFGTWLAEKKDGSPTWLNKFCNWVESKKHRQVYVRIDKFDTWSMDHTLAHIIAPMLVQLQATKHGAPFVDDEDVPEELKSTSAPAKENDWDTDANHFKRWDWALNEMIFAFTAKRDGTWQDKYSSGEHDLFSEPCEWDESGEATLYQMKRGPNDTYECDYDAMAVEQKRISNGFRLFGKYYENLWD
jgi:hypothetical protein